MFADNLNAKRALEEGILDVKQALEGQKLLVDTLKVEMAQDRGGNNAIHFGQRKHQNK